MDDFITFDRNILLCLSWIFNMIYSNRCYRWSTRHIVGCTIRWALSSCLYRARLAFFLKEHSFIRFRKWDSCLFQYLSSDVYIYIDIYVSIVFIYLQRECLCYSIRLVLTSLISPFLYYYGSVSISVTHSDIWHIFC